MHAFDYLYLPIHLFDLAGYFVGIPQGQRTIFANIRGNCSLTRFLLAVILLAIFNVACGQNDDVVKSDNAQNNDGAQKCDYATKVKYHLPTVDNATLLSEAKGIDPDSGENTITYNIQFTDCDKATLEQKYCSMYNFEVSYKIKKLNKLNFKHSLDNIDKLIRSVQQDYQLKAPLKDIVEMTMNQRNLSINSAFNYGLPVQAVNSNEYVEHSINFTPHKDKEQFDAEVKFYFGLGGE